MTRTCTPLNYESDTLSLHQITDSAKAGVSDLLLVESSCDAVMILNSITNFEIPKNSHDILRILNYNHESSIYERGDNSLWAF